VDARREGVELTGSGSDRLVEEQAALRRVATLVASAAGPEQVFATVAEETGRLFGARASATLRLDDEAEVAVVVGRWDGDAEFAGFEVGTHVPYNNDPASASYRLMHEGGRVVDYAHTNGEPTPMMRAAGLRHAAAAPIIAGGRIWGSLFVTSNDHELGPAVEQQLRDFATLVSLALESAEAHDQLAASRARIVEASVAERRRLERNLHDGAQQRLVTLSIQLRIAQVALRDDSATAATMLDGVGAELKLALEELRELARGLHPAILTDRGLAPALQSLATRAPFPVEIAGVPQVRLGETTEAAIYYVVAESLTNAAKHAAASEATVEMSTTDDTVIVEIHDNGSGGAGLVNGAGLRGLADRIEAIGGTFELQSPAGAGTLIRAELPRR
jgi:signal transduction histidine kinase